MGCTVGEGFAICRPSTVTLRAVRVCPCCHERHRQVGSVAVWYDTTWTCLGCGDSYYGDSYYPEGIMPRPFARGWRERERAEARRRWDEAPPVAEARSVLEEAVRG